MKSNVLLKKIFTFSFILLFCGTLFAQNETRSGTGLHFGLKVQPSFAWLKAKDPLRSAFFVLSRD